MKIVEALDVQKSKEKIDDSKKRIITEFHDRLHDVWQYYQLESPDDIVAPIQLVTLQDLSSVFNPEELAHLDELEVISPFRELLTENGLHLFKVNDFRWVVADARPMLRVEFMEILATFLTGVLFFVGFGMLQANKPGLTLGVISLTLGVLIIVLGKRTNSQAEHEKVISGGITYAEMKERLGQFKSQVDVVNTDD